MFCILVGLMFQRYDGFLFLVVFDIGFVYMFCSFILGKCTRQALKPMIDFSP